MPKLPFIKFYPSDWLLDTRILTDIEKSIWIDMICYMWRKEERGVLKGHIDDIARLLGRERLTLECALISFKEKDIADINELPNQWVEIRSRRLLRDAKALKQTNKRVKRFNASINASINTKLTPKKSEVRSQKSDKDSIGVPPTPPPNTSFKEPKDLTELQKVVTAFKIVSGVEKHDAAWDRLYFPRNSKSAKALIDFLGTWQDAADCIQDIYEKFSSKGLTVTLETVVKHASDWKKDKLERRPTNGILPVPSYGSR